MNSKHVNGLASTFIEQVQSQHTTTTVPLGYLEPIEWNGGIEYSLECLNYVTSLSH